MGCGGACIIGGGCFERRHCVDCEQKSFLLANMSSRPFINILCCRVLSLISGSYDGRRSRSRSRTSSCSSSSSSMNPVRGWWWY